MKPEDKVIVAVLENIIEKETDQVDELNKIRTVCDIMRWFMDSFLKTSNKKPSVMFALAYPISRPGSAWMHTNYESIKKEFERAYNSQDKVNIS